MAEHRFFGALRRDTGILRDVHGAESPEQAELLLTHNYTPALKALCDIVPLIVTVAEHDSDSGDGPQRGFYGTVLYDNDFIRDVGFYNDQVQAEELLMGDYSSALKTLYRVRRLNVEIDERERRSDIVSSGV